MESKDDTFCFISVTALPATSFTFTDGRLVTRWWVFVFYCVRQASVEKSVGNAYHSLNPKNRKIKDYIRRVDGPVMAGCKHIGADCFPKALDLHEVSFVTV